MTEPTDLEKLEKRLGDLERQHEKTRGLLIDALSYSMAVLACIYFQPDGWVTTIIIGGGAFIIASRFHRWTLRDQPDLVARFVIRILNRRRKSAGEKPKVPGQDALKGPDHGPTDIPGWLRVVGAIDPMRGAPQGTHHNG